MNEGYWIEETMVIRVIPSKGAIVVRDDKSELPLSLGNPFTPRLALWQVNIVVRVAADIYSSRRNFFERRRQS